VTNWLRPCANCGRPTDPVLHQYANDTVEQFFKFRWQKRWCLGLVFV